MYILLKLNFPFKFNLVCKKRLKSVNEHEFEIFCFQDVDRRLQAPLMTPAQNFDCKFS